MDIEEELESGYRPGTPAGDNLCNDFAQGMAVAFAALARARGDRVMEDTELGLLLTDGGSPALFGNVAVVRCPLPDDAWREAVPRMHRFFAERQGGPFLLFSAWPTPDLTLLDDGLGRPAGAAFGRIGHPPLMLRLPSPFPAENAIEGLEIRPVTDVSQVEDWERTLVDGFADQALQPYRPGCLLPAAGLGASGWRFWTGYLDGRPVATSSAHVGTHHVHVEFIATLDAVRGRGIGGAVTAAATRAEPDLPALLISSDLGRSVYARLGYRSLLRFTLWSGHRAE